MPCVAGRTPRRRPASTAAWQPRCRTRRWRPRTWPWHSRRWPCSRSRPGRTTRSCTTSATSTCPRSKPRSSSGAPSRRGRSAIQSVSLRWRSARRPRARCPRGFRSASGWPAEPVARLGGVHRPPTPDVPPAGCIFPAGAGPGAGERGAGMRWSFTIAKIAGTEVKVHLTFLLLVGYIAYEGWATAGSAAAVSYTLFFLAFFLCIVLHEFGHIAMARRFGVRTPDVILLPIGGVARLERIPEAPRQELLVALAGPAVTVAIIVVLLAIALATGESASGILETARVTGRALAGRGAFPDDVTFVVHLLIVNAAVLVFNLIPAFPLDGGRVLRAVLARRLGLARGTRIAGAIGQMFALVLGVCGFIWSQPIWLLVAFFIFLGAG